MARFRKPEEIVEAVQYRGHSLTVLADELGWTTQELRDRWPTADIDYDRTIYSPTRDGHTERPVPLNVGDWVIVENNKIVSFATEGWFDGWERVE